MYLSIDYHDWIKCYFLSLIVHRPSTEVGSNSTFICLWLSECVIKHVLHLLIYRIPDSAKEPEEPDEEEQEEVTEPRVIPLEDVSVIFSL